MVYGIVSQVDDATTSAYFKSKRVPDVNVMHITQLPSLLQMLKSGDVVFVVSVNRFWSVSAIRKVMYGKRGILTSAGSAIS